MTPWYKEYSDLLAEYFPFKVQKLSIDLGTGCPNRDGTAGRGGCIYCNNAAFSPDMAKRAMPVAEQIARGKRFFAHKYAKMRYLAYFQSYTSTYGDTSAILSAMKEALRQQDVVGLVVSTRPDCLPDDLLNGMANMGAPVFIELGAESSHDETLHRINRCHTWADTVSAVSRCSDAGIPVGLHLIMYLPGEDEAMMRLTVQRAVGLPVASLKFHQLQLLRGTPLATMVASGRMEFGTPDNPEEYAALLARLLPLIPKTIAIERFTASAPPGQLLAPKWGLKSNEFTSLLQKLLSHSVR